VFGKDSGAGAAAPAASAPSDQEIADGVGKSSVEHHHGDAGGSAEPQAEESAAPAADAADDATGGNGPEAKGGAAKPLADENLAETGGDSATPYIATGGAAVLAIGAATLFASVRRRSVAGGRHSR
jgi:chitin-binding protein